jgi:hypothetical protein
MSIAGTTHATGSRVTGIADVPIVSRDLVDEASKAKAVLPELYPSPANMEAGIPGQKQSIRDAISRSTPTWQLAIYSTTVDETPTRPPKRISSGNPLFDDELYESLIPTWHEEPEPETDPRRWSSFLPIFGEALREQGFDLPLPFGLSANYVRIERDIDVDDIQIGINGGPQRSVSSFLQVDSDSAVDVLIARVDVWLLPFLNVYAYGGWQRNDSSVDVFVTIPTPGPGGPLEFRVQDDGEIEGPVYGTGIALAGGYEQFFVTGTIDFAFAEFDEFDSRFEGRIYGLRTGWNGEIHEVGVRAWTGFNYFGTDTKIDGSVNIPAIGQVRFEVDQGPQHPWNGLIGLGIVAPYHIDVMVEYGFNFDDVHALTTGLTFRF